ncbi:MAG: hypothetical protein C0601_11625 [Candidatus Muiribacterium halophilum]|uniref:Uncharacterized protein n=1 Tax=Muiribacterium halophilum TaxID=2053465 RepID=A0A2N5ZBN2_MUIH1|nr:MAG: hypothetical protein C0601_11625 [Candidatus Muirbacterium halophilum]
MNSKDFSENLVIVKRLIDSGDYERANSFINRNLFELKNPIKRFLNREWYSKTIALKIKILFERNEYFKIIEVAEKNSKYLKKDKEALLYVKKAFQETNVYERELLFLYLNHYLYDHEMLKNFTYLIYKENTIDKKELKILKRYCLEFKKDFDVQKPIIKHIFRLKDHDLRSITLLLNFYYYYPDRDEEFIDIIERFVKLIIKRKRTWNRKVFYPVFKFYYDNTKDEKIIPYIFSLIKKLNIEDEFSQELVYSIYKKDESRIDSLSELARIFRNKELDDEKSLKIYSDLYHKKPKDIDNTKYLVNILRKRNLIDDENVNIFLNAHKMFDDQEKKNKDYHELVRYLAEYLQSREMYDKRFSVVVEDILRICSDPTSYIYSINFFYMNKEYKKALFLLERIDRELITEKYIYRYYYLYIKVFILLSSSKDFMPNNWRLVYQFLKKLKRSKNYNVDFEIAQYYLIKRFSDYLPVCFFDYSRCSIWNEKCYFSHKIKKIRSLLSSREMDIIKGYLKRAIGSDEAKFFYRIFVEDTRYIPIVENKPVFFCVNIQKLLSSEKYENVLDIFKDYPEISEYAGFGFWLGRAFYNLGKYDEAIIHFNDCINENPSNAYAYYYRGKSFSKKNLFLVAFNDFQKVVELKLFDNEFLVEIIRIYINKKYYTDAQKIIDILAKKEENLSLANFYKAQVLFFKKKYQEALDVLKQVNETDDKRFPAIILKVRILFHLNRMDDGLKIINSMISDIDNESIFYKEAILTRAKINFELKKYRLVKKDIEKAVDFTERAYIATVEPEYLYIYANACFFVDEPDLARRFLKIYRKRKPFDMRSNILLSKIYLNKDLEEKAISILKMTWFFSKNKEVLTELIRTSDKIGNINKVNEYGKKYISRYAPDKEIFDIYLSNLYKSRQLHTIQNLKSKYHNEMQAIAQNSKEKKGWKKFFDLLEQISNINDQKALIYSVVKNNGILNIKLIFNMQVIDICECKDFPQDYFLDGINTILYVSDERQLETKLRYYCDNIYSFSELALTLEPSIKIEDIDSDPVASLERIGNIISDLSNIQKRIITGTGIIDSYLSEMFDIEMDENVFLLDREKKKDIAEEKIYKINEVWEKNKNFYCLLKFDYINEVIRYQSDFPYKKEFFIVSLWKSLNKEMPTDNTLFLYSNLDENVLSMFFEISDCPMRSICRFECSLEKKDIKEISMPALFNKSYDNEKIEIEKDLKDIFPIIKGRHFYPFEHRLKELSIAARIFKDLDIFFRYDKVLKDYFDDFNYDVHFFVRNLQEKMDIMKKTPGLYIFNIFSLKGLGCTELLLRYNNAKGNMDDFIDFLRKEGSDQLYFVKYISRCIDDLVGFLKDVSVNLSSMYFYTEDKELYIYSDLKKEKDLDISLKELIKDIEYNKEDNEYIRRDSFGWLLSRIYGEKAAKLFDHPIEIKINNVIEVINELKYSKFYFNSWDIREILFINRYLYLETGLNSLIIWDELDFEENDFYLLSSDLNKDTATYIIKSDQVKDIKKEREFINLFIIDSKKETEEYKDVIKFQKLFVFSKDKVSDFHKIPSLISKVRRVYLNKNVPDTEKRDNVIIIEDIKNQKSLFYNRYLSGEIKEVIIEDNRDNDWAAMTGGDFRVIQVDKNG